MFHGVEVVLVTSSLPRVANRLYVHQGPKSDQSWLRRERPTSVNFSRQLLPNWWQRRCRIGETELVQRMQALSVAFDGEERGESWSSGCDSVDHDHEDDRVGRAQQGAARMLAIRPSRNRTGCSVHLWCVSALRLFSGLWRVRHHC